MELPDTKHTRLRKSFHMYNKKAIDLDLLITAMYNEHSSIRCTHKALFKCVCCPLK